MRLRLGFGGQLVHGNRQDRGVKQGVSKNLPKINKLMLAIRDIHRLLVWEAGVDIHLVCWASEAQPQPTGVVGWR